MKKLNKLFLALAGISAVSAGLAVGLVSSTEKAVKTTVATTQTYTKLYLKLDSNYWGQAVAYYTAHVYGGDGGTTWPGLNLGSGSGNETLSVDIPSAQAGYTNVIFVRWKEAEHTTEWNRITLSFNAEQYNYFTNTGWTTAGSSALAASYTVSEYGVVGGTVEGTAFASEIATSTAFTPTDKHRSGYAFGGWYTDSSCTSLYSATVLDADTSLYAKYTACVSSANLYFQVSGWSNIYIYTFGQSEAMGSYPGTKISADNVSTDVNFLGNGGAARCSYFSDSGDTKVVFSDGGSTNKTADLLINENAYYLIADTALTNGDVYKGNAADVVIDISKAVNSTTSVCNVTQANASTLYGKYNSLSETSKGYFDADNTTIYTYTSKTDSTLVNVKLSAVVARLKTIGNVTPSAIVATNDSSSTLVLGGIAAAAVLAAGGYFFVRKKKVD